MDQTLASTANHALEACERMLRPIMRLALDRGLKYQDIDELIRDLMLDEAARNWAKRNGKEPSGSQLSVTTGINRKEVKRRTSITIGEERLPESGKSITAQVFRQWNFEVQAHPELRVLPIDTQSQDEYSFAKLVRGLGGDVHFRSVLDELVRLKLVSENAAQVQLDATSFVPPGAGPEMLALVADNVQAHIAAATANIAGSRPPLLERAVWGEGLSLIDCEKIHTLARETWEASWPKLYEAIGDAPDVDSTERRHRIRIGTYVHIEPIG
jgi:hypothetical protein